MSSILNQQWLYTRHPQTIVGPEHYSLHSELLSTTLSAGEVLVEAHYISVDPYMRINQSLKPSYNELPHALNTVQSAGVVGRVLASSVPHMAIGDYVEGMLGWQTHARFITVCCANLILRLRLSVLLSGYLVCLGVLRGSA